MSVIASIPLAADPASGPVPDAIGHAEHDDAGVVLTRDDRPAAAIVPLHDLRALEEPDDAEDAFLSRVAAEAIAQWAAEGRRAGIYHEDLAR